MRALQFWVETTYSLLSPHVRKKQQLRYPFLFPLLLFLLFLPNVKYLFCLLEDCVLAVEFLTRTRDLSLLCVLLSDPSSVAEALMNSTYVSFHFIPLFLLLHRLGDVKLVTLPLWTPLQQWWRVEGHHACRCLFIHLGSKSGSVLGHGHLSLFPGFTEIMGLHQRCTELSLKFWKGPDAMFSYAQSRREGPSCWVQGLDLVS